MEWNALVFLALVLVCPIAMMVMHGGHGGHGSNESSHRGETDPTAGMSEEQLRDLAHRAEKELDERARQARSGHRH